MLKRVLVGGLFATGICFSAPAAHAACAMDNECAGEQICEEGACVDPPAAPAAPADRAGAATAPKPAPVPSRSIAAEPTAAAEQADERTEPSPPRKGKRHSTSMMVGGIVLTSLAPVALVIGEVAAFTCGENGNGDDQCVANYLLGTLAAVGVLTGVGIPLIVMGARRDPVPTAQLSPWVTRHGAGFGLRFEL